jgi:penicillin-insensitive murein endopeptidase
MRSLRPSLAVSIAALALGLAVRASASPTDGDDRLRRAPWNKMSLSLGAPNAGSQLRAKRLRPAPHLAIRPSSRDRSYGHPSLVLMLQRSAKAVAKARPGSVLLVGDLSSQAGGPLSGHHSHQSGRDADVAFYAKDAKGRPKKLDRFVAFGADGAAKDGSGLVFDDDRNWLLVMGWAKDHRATMAHVFVSNALRARLLAHGRKTRQRGLVPKVAALFKQPENAEPHDDHFHVRIRCPEGHEDLCREESR